jgi:hypothetical protein
MRVHLLIACTVSLLLAACASQPPAPARPAQELSPSARRQRERPRRGDLRARPDRHRLPLRRQEPRSRPRLQRHGVVHLRPRGRHRVSGSAADIARRGRPIERGGLRPGDLVFFNTRNAPFSHVGIYIGDERFVHAPSGSGRVRIDQLDARYYAQRFETARTYFD